jgi:cell cycle checkpoint control protein RAD9A
MAPPKLPASDSTGRRPLRPPGSAKASQISSETNINSAGEGLFVTQDEEDTRWDPNDFREEEETLGWDTSVDHVCIKHPG